MAFGTLTAADKMIRTRIQIQRNNPFFAYLSLYLRFHEDNSPQNKTMVIDARGNL